MTTPTATKLCYPRAGSKLKKPGRVVGRRSCTLEGCGGTRIGVRWPNGKLTWPCLKACKVRDDGQYEIL